MKIRPQTVVKYAAVLRLLRSECNTATKVIKLHEFLRTLRTSGGLTKEIMRLRVIEPDPQAPSGYRYKDTRDPLIIARELANATLKQKTLYLSANPAKPRTPKSIVLEHTCSPAELEDTVGMRTLDLSDDDADLLKLILARNQISHLADFAAQIIKRIG
jgi:hypothetical protein